MSMLTDLQKQITTESELRKIAAAVASAGECAYVDTFIANLDYALEVLDRLRIHLAALRKSAVTP